jgi:predicted SAM-dependent methyltransferase
MKRFIKRVIRPLYGALTAQSIDTERLSLKQLLGNILPIAYYRLKFANRYRLNKLAKQRPCQIIIGANRKFYPEWIPTEMGFFNMLNPGDWTRYFLENSIDAILAEHVWEHLTLEQGMAAARNCFKYLAPGGYLRVAVPDGFHPDPNYIEWVKPGGVGLQAYDHKVLYNYKTFSEVFELAGFKVELLEYFDEAGEFHYKEWNPEQGMITRSWRFDNRNKGGGLAMTSIIIDARK